MASLPTVGLNPSFPPTIFRSLFPSLLDHTLHGEVEFNRWHAMAPLIIDKTKNLPKKSRQPRACGATRDAGLGISRRVLLGTLPTHGNPIYAILWGIKKGRLRIHL